MHYIVNHNHRNHYPVRVIRWGWKIVEALILKLLKLQKLLKSCRAQFIYMPTSALLSVASAE